MTTFVDFKYPGHISALAKETSELPCCTTDPGYALPLLSCVTFSLHLFSLYHLRNSLHNLIRFLIPRPRQRDRLTQRFHRRLPQTGDRPAGHLQGRLDGKLQPTDDLLHLLARLGESVQHRRREGRGDVCDTLVRGSAQAFPVEARLARGAGGFLFAVAVGDFDAFSSGSGRWLVEVRKGGSR